MDYLVAACGLLAAIAVGALLFVCAAAFDDDERRAGDPR